MLACGSCVLLHFVEIGPRGRIDQIVVCGVGVADAIIEPYFGGQSDADSQIDEFEFCRVR